MIINHTNQKMCQQTVMSSLLQPQPRIKIPPLMNKTTVTKNQRKLSEACTIAKLRSFKKYSLTKLSTSISLGLLLGTGSPTTPLSIDVSHGNCCLTIPRMTRRSKERLFYVSAKNTQTWLNITLETPHMTRCKIYSRSGRCRNMSKRASNKSRLTSIGRNQRLNCSARNLSK